MRGNRGNRPCVWCWRCCSAWRWRRRSASRTTSDARILRGAFGLLRDDQVLLSAPMAQILFSLRVGHRRCSQRSRRTTSRPSLRSADGTSGQPSAHRAFHDVLTMSLVGPAAGICILVKKLKREMAAAYSRRGGCEAAARGTCWVVSASPKQTCVLSCYLPSGVECFDLCGGGMLL